MLKSDQIVEYKSIEKILCPYFGEVINFNSKGLNHIKFTGQGKARAEGDQKVRIRHIKYAPLILSNSHTLQGIMTMKKDERVRKEGLTSYKNVEVLYYEFIAVIENKRFKVIVKQVSGGSKFFWSIIPYWKKQVEGRKLHSLSVEDY